jgi:hypothetical protein
MKQVVDYYRETRQPVRYYRRICSAAVFLFLLPLAGVKAQTDTSKKAIYGKILHSKDNITSSVQVSKLPPLFLSKNYRQGTWTGVTWQNQWAEIGFSSGEFGTASDTAMKRGSTFHALAYFPVRKLMKGSRLYDIRGALFVPAISFGYTHVKLGQDYLNTGVRLAPSVSMQFPFFGLDARLNADYHFNPESRVKGFSFFPEIGIRFDGLYNLMDPERVYIGHAEGTITSRNTSYSTTSHRSGDYIVTTTYRTETTTSRPYSIDRYVNSVGAFVAIGPRYTFKDLPYAGKTQLYGLGYYVRTGFWSTDIIADVGKAGFASSLTNPQTVDSPDPAVPKPNKEDSRMTGHYNVWRAQARYGIDLIELYASAFGSEIVTYGNEVKFSRIIGGFGIGYASVSATHYDTRGGEMLADSLYTNDFTLLSSSRNYARLGQSGVTYSFYTALEAGCIQISFERTFYARAALASTKNVSVAYLFPYNRIRKKHKAIQEYKNYIQTH